jgi:hypothetical protein
LPIRRHEANASTGHRFWNNPALRGVVRNVRASTPPTRTLERWGLGAAIVAVVASVVLHALALPFPETIATSRDLLVVAVETVFVGGALVALVAATTNIMRSASTRPSVVTLVGTLLAAALAPSPDHGRHVDLLFAAIAFVGWLAPSVRATRRVLRETDAASPRRRWQLGLTWALPYVGAILILSFYGSLDAPRRDDGFDAEPGGHTTHLG